MIFNSITFLLFLVIVICLYWLLPRNIRNWMVFLSSLLFYGFWKWEFLSIVLLSTFTDYFVALELGKTEKSEERKRKLLLYTSLFINLSLLLYFKYLIFFTDNITFFLQSIGVAIESPALNIILPLGISFYTFQTISYTIDVYRNHTKPIKDFALYGSYVTFFPQLVAGPILRAEEVVNQLDHRPKFNPDLIVEGLKRVLYGFFLKVVLADNIAPLVDAGYALPPGSLSAIDVWTLAFIFGFQIYFDFAGYSHIAIGCAKMMGIDFPENFNFPYAAKSFKSFWKRWHISLSSWIRDYLYLPLAGADVIDPNLKSRGGIDVALGKNEITQGKKNRALFLTWVIMGFWHGANWTFVFWGVYHSGMIYLERLFKPFRDKFSFFSKPFIGWCITLPLAMLGWIAFRAESLTDVFIMLSKVINPLKYTFYSMRENTYLVTALLFLFTSLSYLATNIESEKTDQPTWWITSFNVVKYAVIFILVFTFFRPISQFIYFQF